MKAIGARNKDILMIFFIKAELIGLIWGILGVALGALAFRLGGRVEV